MSSSLVIVRLGWVLKLVVVAACASSCGDDDGKGDTGNGDGGSAPILDGGNGAARPDWLDPSVDTTPVACTRIAGEVETRPSVHVCGGGCAAAEPFDLPPETDGECTTASDCTDGLNGTCRMPSWGTSVCVYDECFSDEDCAADEACRCGDGGGFVHNTCLRASCRTDADCEDGYECTLSLLPGPALCEPEQQQFHCSGEADTCASYMDCLSETDPYVACVFDPSLGHRTCQGQAVCPM